MVPGAQLYAVLVLRQSVTRVAFPGRKPGHNYGDTEVPKTTESLFRSGWYDPEEW